MAQKKYLDLTGLTSFANEFANKFLHTSKIVTTLPSPTSAGEVVYLANRYNIPKPTKAYNRDWIYTPGFLIYLNENDIINIWTKIDAAALYRYDTNTEVYEVETKGAYTVPTGKSGYYFLAQYSSYGIYTSYSIIRPNNLDCCCDTYVSFKEDNTYNFRRIKKASSFFVVNNTFFGEVGSKRVFCLLENTYNIWVNYDPYFMATDEIVLPRVSNNEPCITKIYSSSGIENKPIISNDDNIDIYFKPPTRFSTSAPAEITCYYNGSVWLVSCDVFI